MAVTYYMPDCIGYIQRLEVFGNDLTVVNAARVSFHKESSKLSTGDAKLLTYLAKHDHISPFFHPQVRFRIKMPIFVAREWFRHTVGLSRNEVSRRYIDSQPQCWIPDMTQIRERDPKSKQGSKSTPVQNSYDAYHKITKSTKDAVDTYNDLLKDGIAPEIARSVLPQSMYTEFIETGSLYAYARICSLRSDPNAQAEIRQFAKRLDMAMAVAFPISWKALRTKFKGENNTHVDRYISSSPIIADYQKLWNEDRGGIGHFGTGC